MEGVIEGVEYMVEIVGFLKVMKMLVGLVVFEGKMVSLEVVIEKKIFLYI